MKKIPVTAWLKMFVILGVHLCILGYVVYCYREPMQEYALAAWGYVTWAYEVCAQWVVEMYNKMPSPQQLVDGFINILKLQPFTK